MRTLSTLSLAFLAACASAPGGSESAGSPAASPSAAAAIPPDSSVEITYVLGHSHRKFQAEAKSDQVLARTFMEHQILREGPVDSRHYQEFLDKAGRFVGLPSRDPAEGQDCRSPFKITVRARGELHSTNGCRGHDDGALARLLRDGEFLLSAQK